MAGFDLFGLKKDASQDSPASGGGLLPPKAWKGLAAADALVLVACLTLLAVRVRGHLSAPPLPPAKPAPGRKAEPPKPEPAEAKKPEPKPEAKVEAKKPEPKKPEAKVPSKEAEKKPPLGSPAVHAAPTPKRDPAPVGATPPPTPSFAPKKNGTRPVPFSYEEGGAKEVYLVGPFLVRSGGRKTMFKDSRGVWQTTVYLNIGQNYKYRFEVVGEGGKKLTAPRSVEVLEAD